MAPRDVPSVNISENTVLLENAEISGKQFFAEACGCPSSPLGPGPPRGPPAKTLVSSREGSGGGGEGTQPSPVASGAVQELTTDRSQRRPGST